MKLEKLKSIVQLRKEVENLKKQNKKIVLTSGSWDMLHVGHMRYLKQVKEKGDILIVGVDSDKKIKQRKGPDRPIVPELERVEMLSYLEYIDFLFLKDIKHKSGLLIETIKPDVLIISETTGHKKEHLKEILKFCKEIINLPPQAETSTTARIRLLHINGKKEFIDKFMKSMPEFINSFLK